MPINHEIVSDHQHMQIYFTTVQSFNELLPAHWHEHLEVLCVLEGGLTIWTGEVSTHLNEGDIFVAAPGIIHFTRSDSSCLYYLLQIPPVHLRRIGQNWQQRTFLDYIPASGPSPVSFPDAVSSAEEGAIQLNTQLRTVLDEMYRLYKTSETQPQSTGGTHLLVLSKVYELLYLLLAPAAEQRGETDSSQVLQDRERIEHCMDYVREHYSEHIGLSEAAALLSVTPEHFCRMFKRQTGQTFLTYVQQVRLMHFYQELLQSDRSISYLLDKHGITNYKAFLKLFRSTYGASPQQVRHNRHQ